LTVCVKSGDVLPLKLLLPLYSAVTVCAPSVRDETAPLVALPPLKLTGEPNLIHQS
jgi:hypothetical protein